MRQNGKARLTIGELARATGQTVHTLRYYDDSGLIPHVERNAAGHRRFRQEHVNWIGLLERLRFSGMSIARMREYGELASRGDASRPDRVRLLKTHAAELRARIAELERCHAIVAAKIDFYEGRLSDAQVVWDLVARERNAPDRATNGLRG